MTCEYAINPFTNPNHVYKSLKHVTIPLTLEVHKWAEVNGAPSAKNSI
jgi:hypothetical protein